MLLKNIVGPKSIEIDITIDELFLLNYWLRSNFKEEDFYLGTDELEDSTFGYYTWEIRFENTKDKRKAVAFIESVTPGRSTGREDGNEYLLTDEDVGLKIESLNKKKFKLAA